MAARTWTGLAVDANWSSALNWNGGVAVPAAGDTVTFNTTGAAFPCTVDNIGTFNGSITVASTYGNTITQNVATPSAAFSIASGVWVQAATFNATTFDVTAGTFTGASQAMNTTAVTISGGTLTATSGTWTITGAVTQSGSPTLSNNGGHVILAGGTNVTVDFPGFTFNTCAITRGGSVLTIAAGTTIPLGATPTVTGSVTVNGTLTWSGVMTVTATLNTGAAAVLTNSGTKGISIGGSLTFHATATITAAIPITFTNTGTVTYTSTVYACATSSKPSGTGNLIVAAGTTLPLGADPTVTGSLDIQGTLTWSGTLTCLVFTTGAAATLTIGGTPGLTAQGSVTFHATATITAGLTVTLNGTGSQTYTSTAYLAARVNISHPGVGGTVTIAANTTANLDTNPTTSGGITINGTIVTSGAWTASASVITLGATGTISGTTTLTIPNSDFVGTAGGVCAGLTVVYDITTGTARTFTGGGLTYAGFTRTGAGAGALTITGTNTFGTFTDNLGLVAHTITFPNVTTTVGTFNVAGSAGKLVTIQRTGAAGVFTLTKSTAGNVSCDYLSISNSTADAVPLWYAGANSTNGGGNTNWIFASPPTTKPSLVML